MEPIFSLNFLCVFTVTLFWLHVSGLQTTTTKRTTAPGMKASGETLLLFACGGHACILYSCGNRDNPGRSQRSLGAPASPSFARVDFT